MKKVELSRVEFLLVVQRTLKTLQNAGRKDTKTQITISLVEGILKIEANVRQYLLVAEVLVESDETFNITFNRFTLHDLCDSLEAIEGDTVTLNFLENVILLDETFGLFEIDPSEDALAHKNRKRELELNYIENGVMVNFGSFKVL